MAMLRLFANLREAADQVNIAPEKGTKLAILLV